MKYCIDQDEHRVHIKRVGMDTIDLGPHVFRFSTPYDCIITIPAVAPRAEWFIDEVLTELLVLTRPAYATTKTAKYLLNKHGVLNYTYGQRWSFQWSALIDKLKQDPGTRQGILSTYQMFDIYNTDIPCTMFYQFRVVNGSLDTLLVMRSSDLLRGFRYDLAMLGFMNLMMSALIGVTPGQCMFFTNSLHTYVTNNYMLRNDVKTLQKILNKQSIGITVEDPTPEFENSVTISEILTDVQCVYSGAGVPRNPIFQDMLRIKHSWHTEIKTHYMQLFKRNKNKK